MDDGATTRSFTCFGSIVACVPSPRLSTICVADSLTTLPTSVVPLVSVRVTLSKPGAICALGFTTDSSEYFVGRFAVILDKFGPASPPSPPTLWQRAQG